MVRLRLWAVTKFDIHIHTRRYSPCSDIDPFELLPRAAEVGLSGIVIVEHDAMWNEKDVDRLRREHGADDVSVFAGTEIRSRHGDLLVLGVRDLQDIKPGESARHILKTVHDRGGAVVIAHPTRYGLGCDPILFDMEFDGMEVMSANMCADEQDQALALSSSSGIRAVAASDAHTLQTVGDYYTVFDDPINNIEDLVSALREGRFRTVLERDLEREAADRALREGTA
jgi:predicted metal-dependent phosphoesterase TrpH